MGSVRMMQDGGEFHPGAAQHGVEEGTVSPPRTTIVGGRPPETGPTLPLVPTGIQQLLRLAAVDEAFRQRFLEERAALARLAHIPLTAAESAILTAIPAKQLAQMAMHLPSPPPAHFELLRRTAAAALVSAALVTSCKTDSAEEPNPSRLTERPMSAEGGISPHLVPTPGRATDRPTTTRGGIGPSVEPELPREEDRPMVSGGGIRPDLHPRVGPLGAEDGGVAPSSMGGGPPGVFRNPQPPQGQPQRPERNEPTRGIRSTEPKE